MTTKELFLSDKELSKFWAGITGSKEFEKVLVYARASFFEMKPDRVQSEAVETFCDMLSHLAENRPEGVRFPSPGLRHDLDNPQKGK